MTRTLDPAPPQPPAPAAAPSPRPSARVYRRRRIVVFGTLGMLVAGLVGGGAYATTTLNAPIPAAAPSVIDPAPIVAAPQVVDQPDFGAWAVGAVGFDGALAAGNDSTAMPIAYTPREAPRTVLDQVVREHLATFLATTTRADPGGLPAFLEQEFRGFLDCGTWSRRFARFQCSDCHPETLVQPAPLESNCS